MLCEEVEPELVHEEIALVKRYLSPATALLSFCRAFSRLRTPRNWETS